MGTPGREDEIPLTFRASAADTGTPEVATMMKLRDLVVIDAEGDKLHSIVNQELFIVCSPDEGQNQWLVKQRRRFSQRSDTMEVAL